MSNVPITFFEFKLVICENVYKNKCNNKIEGKTQENRKITKNNIENVK